MRKITIEMEDGNDYVTYTSNVLGSKGVELRKSCPKDGEEDLKNASPERLQRLRGALIWEVAQAIGRDASIVDEILGIEYVMPK